MFLANGGAAEFLADPPPCGGPLKVRSAETEMAYLMVFLVAVAVGAAVYVVTIREAPAGPVFSGLGRGDAAALSEGDAAVAASEQAGAYVRVSAMRPDWQTRLTGFLGLIVAVVMGAVVIAVSLYVAFSWLAHFLGGIVSSGSSVSTPGP